MTDAVSILRVPPHSLEAEQSLLGGLLLDNSAWDRVSDLLSESDFYRREHVLIYAAIGQLIIAKKPADIITVFERLCASKRAEECGGLPYLNELAQSTPSAANARRYAEIVRERSLRRSLVSVGDQIASMAWDADEEIGKQIDRAAELLGSIERRQIRKAPADLAQIMIHALDRYNEMASGGGERGWSIGVPPIDRTLNGGLKPGKVYGIAARPSVGKSSLARSFGLATSKGGRPTLLLSQEMPNDEVADCIVAQLGRIDSARVQNGVFEDDEWSRLTEACDLGITMPFYVDDQGALTLNDIRTKARMVKGIKVLILDYLQLTSSALKDANRNSQIEEVSRGLKALAMSMNIAVVVLSQLNRDVEKRADKEPQLGDLRDSGAIEQDLDVAILLWTFKEFEDSGRRIVGCKIAKNRGGAKARFALEFHAPTYQWHESTASLDTTKTEEMGRRKGFDL